MCKEIGSIVHISNCKSVQDHECQDRDTASYLQFTPIVFNFAIINVNISI